MALQLVHITDKGAERPSNQDSFCARISNFGSETIAMLVVCDGVGGLQSGELASTGAVRCFEEWFEQQLPGIVQSGLSADAVFFSWHKMLEKLHTALCRYSEQTGMQLGTTVSALLLTTDTLYQVQIGDSRIYLDDGECLRQLSKDQTLAMREVEAGRLSPETLLNDRRSGILLQCLGFGRMEPVFQCTKRPKQGAALLCSDGFCHKTTSQQLHLLLEEGGSREQLQQWLFHAVKFCRSRGETDNITALVLKWDDLEGLQPSSGDWIEVWARVSGEAAPEEYDQKLGGIL